MYTLCQITHVDTKKVFLTILGAKASKVTDRLLKELQAGTFHMKDLQRLYKKSPHVIIETIVTKTERLGIEQSYVVLAETLITKGELNPEHLTKQKHLTFHAILTYTLPRPTL